MNYITAAHTIDGYKVSHKEQYPVGTTQVYSNFTARNSKYFKQADFDGNVVVFGTQYLVDYLHTLWRETFFKKPIAVALDVISFRIKAYSGHTDFSHFEQLHNLGYLPITIKALPEGTLAPLQTPILTITNTHPDFFWLPNYLETFISCELWHIITSATVAREYSKVLKHWSDLTCDNGDHLPFQAHDFSMRGHTSVHSAAKSGAAHLLFSMGTDTVPAIDFLEYYYNDFTGHSIPASEHSTMTANIQSYMPELDIRSAETATFKDLITRVYPSGIVALVSDSYNFWDTLTITLPELKDTIMARDGKLVIRPDSGNPIDVICGKKDGYPSQDEYEFAIGSVEFKGAIEVLWDIFGGTTNDKGYRVLDPHIGLIYGDSITIDRANEICKRLKAKGFASSNIVFGLGSYTYQGTTRDTFGMAIKATAITNTGRHIELYKDPADDSSKKSAKGLMRVDLLNGRYVTHDQVSWEAESGGCLKPIYSDGTILSKEKFSEIKARLN